MRLSLLFPLVCAIPFLTACSDWLGDEEEPPLPGERISLRESQKSLLADAGLEEETVILPAMPVNAAWPQALGNATGVSGNLALGKSPKVQDSVKIGEGEAFSSPLAPAPIIADGSIFAMDGQGNISAHAVADPAKTYWKSAALVYEDEDASLLGGGVAWSGGVLYAANDAGMVVALNATNGKKRWLKELKLPLRSPPRLAGSFVLVLTADNQLLALRQNNGELQWSHRGISEIAGSLHASPPAVRDKTVLVSYNSGELVALDLDTGSPIWTDNLADTGLQASSASGSTVSPIMATGISFACGSTLLAAFESDNGRRLWDRTVPCASAPWLAGNYLFILTPRAQLAAIRGIDGGLQWVADLPKEEGKKILWHGPVVAGESIWLVGENGQLLSFSAQEGKILQDIEVPEGILTAPVIAGEAMYLLDKEARLQVVK